MSTVVEFLVWVAGTLLVLCLITVTQPKHERIGWLIWGGTFYLTVLALGLTVRGLGWLS